MAILNAYYLCVFYGVVHRWMYCASTNCSTGAAETGIYCKFQCDVSIDIHSQHPESLVCIMFCSTETLAGAPDYKSSAPALSVEISLLGLFSKFNQKVQEYNSRISHQPWLYDNDNDNACYKKGNKAVVFIRKTKNGPIP